MSLAEEARDRVRFEAAWRQRDDRYTICDLHGGVFPSATDHCLECRTSTSPVFALVRSDRGPSLAEAEAVMRYVDDCSDSAEMPIVAVVWQWTEGTVNDDHVLLNRLRLRRCACADRNVCFSTRCCLACSAVAEMTGDKLSDDEPVVALDHPEDRAARYELAERTLLRLEAVVAQLKREQGGAP